SGAVSSTAVVAVARTRPSASSTRRPYSSMMASSSSRRAAPTRSFPRLTPSGPALPSRREATASCLRCLGMVGLDSTLRTSDLESTLRTATRRVAHSSSWPCSRASSKMARAYRLAAACAIPCNFGDGLLDQMPVALPVKGLSHHPLCRRHHQIRDLGSHGLQRLLAFRLDVTPGVFDDPFRLLLGLRPQVRSQQLGCAVGALDDLGRLPSRIAKLGVGLLEALLRLRARLLGRR